MPFDCVFPFTYIFGFSIKGHTYVYPLGHNQTTSIWTFHLLSSRFNLNCRLETRLSFILPHHIFFFQLLLQLCSSSALCTYKVMLFQTLFLVANNLSLLVATPSDVYVQRPWFRSVYSSALHFRHTSRRPIILFIIFLFHKIGFNFYIVSWPSSGTFLYFIQ